MINKMNEQDFKNWLEKRYLDSSTTVANRISNCRNVEKYYGDLKNAYKRDKCAYIIEELKYSTNDERENKKQNHLVPIDGNIRTGSATLKQAVRLYVDFRDEENFTMNLNNTNLIVENQSKHDVLVNKILSFVYDKKNHSDILILQDELTNFLNENCASFLWETEYRITEEFKDRIDIIGISKKQDYKHVIELDAHRADQVSKKFVSRMALLENENICYTAICYSGTKSMSKNETLKYFKYCQILADSFPKEKSFRGVILE